ncbi:hypothetical protein J3458_002828 [Metarhizium acridum]|uniref:uncharacterized protein n=1 Tax=Metarhizium acridum TaxID=92637 RepID=UPI001C6B9B82|nr:hypothetical protein J3458_002828 [Metarhizium acridum]
MCDEWNTHLHGPMEEAYRAGLDATVPDVRFYRERLSGLWDPSSEMEVFLRKQGITTLLFTGVNTDKCVLATIQDASTKGFDTASQGRLWHHQPRVCQEDGRLQRPEVMGLCLELRCAGPRR